MADIETMQDASEIIHYDQADIPLYIQGRVLSKYPDMKALCHWHEDIEIIYIQKGEMRYNINGKSILLQEKDCLIVNSRQLHYGYSNLHHECHFICILFHPGLLSANKKIYNDYVRPFTECETIEYILYTPQISDYDHVASLVNQIYLLKGRPEDGYELEIISTLYRLWKIFFNLYRPVLNKNSAPGYNDIALQKKMVAYIYEHYQNSLTLDEISASANVSRSKCCKIFKKYLQQSPIDFTNEYRLKVSCHLLANTRSSIAQIAISCGFNHLSYFSKIFLHKYGCTPTEYRKQHNTIYRI
ncbi:MAG: AraC family transcriptional regulator [Eubacteriales bacterium]|nr:AraC family transcriptional regulator [Eubacteriales bacterium]